MVDIIADRFELRELLGAGGMGKVYAAIDLTLQREVAVKVLTSDLPMDADSIQRLQREARALASIDDPGIVRILDFGVTGDNEPFLVMERLHGDSLAQILTENGALPPEEVLAIAVQIVETMTHVHSQGILHRDLKPSNILLVDGRVKIIDLGIAFLFDADQKLTATGAAIGSPLYMSPEQARNTEVDQRSDIYSLGCLIFAMLAGRPPFSGQSALETIEKHCNEVPPSLVEAADGAISEGLANVVDRCLEKDPERRFASMRDIKEVLCLLDRESQNMDEEADSRTEMSLPLFPLALTSAVCLLLALPLMLLIQPEDPPTAPVPPSPGLLDDLNQVVPATSAKLIRSRDRLRAVPDITDSDLKQLAVENKVYGLSLNRSSITGEGLKYASRLPIRILSLRDTKLEDAFIDSVLNIHTIRELDISGCEGVSDSGIEKLATLPDLQTIYVGSRNLTSMSFERLARVPGLTTIVLRFPESSIPEGAIEALSRSRSISTVYFLSCKKIPEAAPVALNGFRLLSSCGLSHGTLTVDLARQFSKVTTSDFHLSDCDIRPGSIMELSRCRFKKIHFTKIKDLRNEITQLKKERADLIIFTDQVDS